jgi:hypothetical protein
MFGIESGGSVFVDDVLWVMGIVSMWLCEDLS